MFGALAEFERSLIRERTQAGLAAALRVGRTSGRPAKLTEDDLEVARALLGDCSSCILLNSELPKSTSTTLLRSSSASGTTLQNN
jgi:DNA invertase Pin-like site-specific DNA recombinase